MNREETIFEQALGCDSPAAREAYLREACAGNEPLFQSLQGLLRVHDRAGKFMDPRPPTAGGDADPSIAALLGTGSAPVTEKSGDRIGRYKLLEKIGEGGCGVVYMAEQEEPVRRRVALKVIKLGMDTKQVIARFEAERQALALMDHPNIARIFDAGVTGAPVAAGVSPAVEPGVPPGGTGVDISKRSESSSIGPGGKMPPSTAGETPAATLSAGRPYFVMELVRGIKITDFCDENKVSTADRLKLFIQVCQAIQHAHQKGIIHRDIKPSNILVTLHDGVPVPKVIDFGIAKATQGRLTDKTVFTAFHQFLGTPAYMSPEQAEMSGLDIDTRSDIYSLGVLLYELLTGRPPFDQTELLAAGLDEMRRTIREQEPLKPSTRLTQELVAAPRQSAADSADENGGALPRRRSGQIQELIKLVRGDLDWIVMKALEKDRTRRYETANGFATDLQRHLNNEPVVARPPGNLYRFQKLVRRNKIAVAATSAVAAALIIGLVASTWLFFKESRARQRAEAAELKAKTEADKSEQVVGFLADMLDGAGPEVAKGRDATILREILDKTAERIGKELTNQPEVEAKLRSTLGDTYSQMGDFAKAEAMHRQALRLAKTVFGETSGPVASSLRSLGADLYRQGKQPEAEAELHAALAVLKKMPDGGQGLMAAVPEALAVTLVGQGKPGAEALSREALELRKKLAGKDVGGLGISIQNRAVVLATDGKLAEAEAMYREAVPMLRQACGDEDLHVATALGSLARVLSMEGKVAEAEPMAREALTIQKKLLGNDHQSVSSSLLTLSLVLTQEGKSGEAVALYRDALAASKKANGDSLVSYGIRLAQLLDDEGNRAEAEPLARDTLALARKLEGDGSLHFANALSTVLRILQREKKFDEYEKTVREILTPALQSNPKNAVLLLLRAQYFGHGRRWKEAEADAAKIIDLSPSNYQPYHMLAAALVASEDLEGYRSLCGRMLARFGHTTDLLPAEATARDCLILPNSGADLVTVSNLAQVVSQVATNHAQFWWFHFCKGLAEYREGRFASAVDHMRQTMAGEAKAERDFQACMVLAMAHCRLNQMDEAGVAFAKGMEIEHPRLPDTEPSGYRNADNWVDWVLGHALMKEAKSLIEASVKSGSKTK